MDNVHPTKESEKLQLITSGGVPLNIRDHAYLLGEAVMTLWFTEYNVSADLIEAGMARVREETAEEMSQYDQFELAPASIPPFEHGMMIANSALIRSKAFKEGEVRDFDAIVEAVKLIVIYAADASSFVTPIESMFMTIANNRGMDKGPRSE